MRADNTLIDVGGAVEVQGPGFGDAAAAGTRLGGSSSTPGSGQFPWFRIEDGRITGEGRGERLDRSWKTRALGRGYVVTARHSANGSATETFAYGNDGDLLVLREWEQVSAPGGELSSRRSLELTDITIDAKHAVQSKPPAGPGTDALRAVWQAAYRYPTEPLEITADVEITTPGTDLTWLGHKRVKGHVTMHGIGRHWRDLKLEVTGGAGVEHERRLASALHDRLLMWYGQDPNDRQDFDAYFAGATIAAPTSAGEFRVTDGPLDAVVVQKDRLAAFVLHGGQRRTFEYRKFGDREAVTEITTGDEAVHVTLDDFDGRLVPVKLRFERVFGRDWGPETIVFRGLTVR